MPTLFKPTYRDHRSGETRTSKTWYTRIGGRRYSLGVTDKRIAERRASALLLEIEGGTPRLHTATRAAKSSVHDHLDALATSLRAKGCTTAHVSLVIARLRAVFTGTSATRIGDLQRADVEGWLAAQQQSGAMSAQTRKHHAAHLRQFGRFLLREGVVTADPFKQVTLAVNVEADRRLQRRSLTTEELRKLLDTVGGSPKRRCLMSGPVRRLAYWTVATTGLRRNELGSLTPESFDFRGATPLVRVEGRHAKNRRTAALPLRTDLAAELKAWLVDKPAGVPVFPVKGGATSKMLAADLAEAGITSEKDGRRVDFHALRTTQITQLALAGVPLVVAQKLARHSTPALTANAYSVFGSTELQKAVEQLPSFLTLTEEEQLEDG